MVSVLAIGDGFWKDQSRFDGRGALAIGWRPASELEPAPPALQAQAEPALRLRFSAASWPPPARAPRAAAMAHCGRLARAARRRRGAGPGSGVMMLTGGVEAALGNSALVGLPVGIDGGKRRDRSAGAAAARRIPRRRVTRDQAVIDPLVHVGDDLVVIGQRPERRAVRRRAMVARQPAHTPSAHSGRARPRGAAPAVRASCCCSRRRHRRTRSAA